MVCSHAIHSLESPVSLLRIKFCYFIYLLLYSFLPQNTTPAAAASISTASMPIGIASPVLVPLVESFCDTVVGGAVFSLTTTLIVFSADAPPLSVTLYVTL